MLKVKILSVGKIKESWLKEALDEYTKRLTGTAMFQWQLVKEEKELDKAVLQEKKFICLDAKGETLSSEKFSKKLFEYFQKEGSEITLIIGGSTGLSSSLLSKAHSIWSLSALTFTHQMTRLILVEQIYRALEIQKGSPYHK